MKSDKFFGPLEGFGAQGGPQGPNRQIQVGFLEELGGVFRWFL